MKETRSAAVLEVRGENEGEPKGFTARAVNYGVADSHRTSWTPGVFTESLERSLPPVVWGHDWNDPIGRVVGYREVEQRAEGEPGGLDIDVELDDFDAVPRAKQAYAQLRSGTMKEFSFAFERVEDADDPNLRGVTQIRKANVSEFSIVMKGSVPGTKPLAIRAHADGDELVPEQRATDLVGRMQRGEISLQEALTELDSLRAPRPVFEFRAVGDIPEEELERVRAALADLDGDFRVTVAPAETEQGAGETEQRSAPEPEEEITDALSVLDRLSR